MNTRQPTHPGEVFYEDVLQALGITITDAAHTLGVSRKTLSELVNGRCNLTPEMAIRIAQATNTSAESWINMQIKYDLWKVKSEKKFHIVPFEASVA